MKTLITSDDPWTRRIVNMNKDLLNELRIKHIVDPRITETNGCYDSNKRRNIIFNGKPLKLIGNVMTDENNLKTLLSS